MKPTIEIKQSMYCYVRFYSLYVNGRLHKNYGTLKLANKELARLTDEA